MKFEGTLTQEEFDFVLELGLSQLMMQGALPMIIDQGDGTLSEPPESMQ